MIQSLKVKNFLSFRDEITLSFEASEDKFAQEYQVVQLEDPAKTRLLRLGIIYGYNASGKTNLLKAFDFLKSFWAYPPSSPETGIHVSPFKLDSSSVKEPTCFEIVFFSGEHTKFLYQLELNASVVLLEKLSYYSCLQEVMLFEKTTQNGHTQLSIYNQDGGKVTESVKEKILVECSPNMSLFAVVERAHVSLPMIDKAAKWTREQFMPLICSQTDFVKPAQLLTHQDKNAISYLKDFFHRAGFNITDIRTELKPVRDSDVLTDIEELPNSSSPYERDKYLNKPEIVYPEITFIHTVKDESGNVSYAIPLQEESSGTIKAFGIAAALYYAVNKQAFLAIDDVENSLHPALLEKILFEFLSNSSQSQLLITTHNDDLLDLINDLIRKDSIWFTEKDKRGSTSVYKLTDFRGINDLPSIRKAYRNKRFGATIGCGSSVPFTRDKKSNQFSNHQFRTTCPLTKT